MALESPRMRLASLLLKQPVTEFIAQRRAEQQSWITIRDAIRDATDGEIDVSWQAVQQWAGRTDEPVPA